VVYSYGVTYFILKYVDKFVPVRVPEEVEVKGLDEAIHGETAYRLS
jgi:Amt family ammonium transporter